MLPLAAAAVIVASPEPTALGTSPTRGDRAPSSALRRRTVRLVSVAFVGLGFIAVTIPAAATLTGLRRSHRGNGGFALFPEDVRAQHEERATDTSPMRRTGGTIFIVRQDAAFWYLAGRLHNPLPFDYPSRADFGGNGERGVIQRLDRGAARWICLAP